MIVADTNLFMVLIALAVTGGIAVIAAVIGVCVMAIEAQDKGRALLPWGIRRNVEKARAQTEIEEQRLQQDALELKRIELESVRAKAMAAYQAGESVGLEEFFSKNKQLRP